MIRKQADGYWHYDLGSFNGSYLNGTRITTTRRPTKGDVLDLAEHGYRFLQKGGASRENPARRLAAMRAIRDLRAACEAIYDSKRELFDSLDLNFKPEFGN